MGQLPRDVRAKVTLAIEYDDTCDRPRVAVFRALGRVQEWRCEVHQNDLITVKSLSRLYLEA
jgi:hypothetical protein